MAGSYASSDRSRRLKPHQKRIVAIDCEMVEVNYGPSALARCSIVDYDGKVIFNEYVRPEQRVTNYRTKLMLVEYKSLT